MSATFDNALYLGLASGGSALTTSFTTSGSDRVLTIGIYTDSGNTDYFTATNAVTYNGVNMTRLTSEFNGNVGNTFFYYLIGPTSGAHNIVITPNTTVTFKACACSFNGANNVNNVAVRIDNSTLTSSVTVTSASGNMVVDFVAEYHGTSPSSNGTTRCSDNTDDGVFTAQSTAAGSGTVTLTYTSGTIQSWALTGANIVAGVQPVATNSNFLNFM